MFFLFIQLFFEHFTYIKLFFYIVSPHITQFSFEEEPSMGDTVQVTCLVSKGDMPVTFSWLFNGEKIPIDMSVNIVPVGKKTSLLTIEYVDQSHIGNFTCVASNRAGIVMHSAELFVKGRIIVGVCKSNSFLVLIPLLLRVFHLKYQKRKWYTIRLSYGASIILGKGELS